MNTPWGRSDSTETFARGFSFVGTPSHGGFAISEGFAKLNLSDAVVKRGERRGGYVFFEEDIAWAIPAWELRQYWDGIFAHSSVDARANPEAYLLSTLSAWYPDYLIEVGVEPLPEEYGRWKDRQLDLQMREQRHPDLVVSAEGPRSWNTITEDQVLVHTADGKKHVVTAASYDARSGINLLSGFEVIDQDVGGKYDRSHV